MVAVTIHPLRILTFQPGFSVWEILFDIEIIQQSEQEKVTVVYRVVYGDGTGCQEY